MSVVERQGAARMNIIIVCGECYSGKGMLISKLEKIFSDSFIIHIGDIVRSKADKLGFDFNKQLALSGDIIAEIIDEQIFKAFCYNMSSIIIDNPMKNVEQAEAVLGMFKRLDILENVKVVWVSNSRTNTDYSKRGRIDDNMIPKKIEAWKKEGSKLRKYIEDNNIPIFDVMNVDEGFLFV